MSEKRTQGGTGGTGSGISQGATPLPEEVRAVLADAPPAVTPEGERAAIAAMVAGYLRAHPDFLNQHPEVLAELHLSHLAVGGVVSLVERQVRILRGQLQTERSRLTQLITRAREYEAFAARLHGLVLALISAPDLERVQAVLDLDLMREFGAQAVALRLFPLDAADPRHDRDPVVTAFRDFLGRRHTLCGPLDETKLGVLFGSPDPDGAPVRCAALIPIRAQGFCGVLAIGATDPERFRPELGTDLLDRLGEVVSRKLEVLLALGPGSAHTEPAPAAAPKPRRTRPRKGEPALSPVPTPVPPIASQPQADPQGAPTTAPKPRRRPKDAPPA